MALPLAVIFFVLLRYDVIEDASIAVGTILLAFGFEPRSWTIKEDGSVAYKTKKTRIVFRPVPLRKLQRKKGNFHIVFKTGRELDFPVAGLKKREKDALFAHMEKSLV
ncbi:hypothetical protein P4C99_06905 [Pontiellaceae bacterium B1224]|nr:hypothetical protein [Pontiellaceae bacterium B1224]